MQYDPGVFGMPGMEITWQKSTMRSAAGSVSEGKGIRHETLPRLNEHTEELLSGIRYESFKPGPVR